MNKLYRHRHLIRENLITLVGICLCIYFVYHALYGNRSVMRLASLNTQIETMSQKDDSLRTRRQALEGRVVMMRPGSLNRDLLEEQARLVLGFVYPGEITILKN